MSENIIFTQDRIDRALRKFDDFWRGRSSEPMVSIYNQPSYRQVFDEEKMVSMAVECIRKDAAGNAEEILPCFWPDFGTVSTARMWGGEIIPATAEGCIHIHPIAYTTADLAKLSPAPFEDTDYALAIKLYRQVCDRLGMDNIFVRTPCFQGPLNTLSLMMEQTEFLCGMYEDPESIHYALNHITDTIIGYVSRYCDIIGRDKVVGSIWPYISMPATTGICITEDYMPLLSAEQYAEFGLPYVKRIADTFGGVWIHCCGTYRQHLQTLRHGNFKIWGLELAYPQMTVQEVYNVFGDDIAYLVGISPDGEEEFPNIIEYARNLTAQPCSKGRFWFASCQEWIDGDKLREVVKGGFGHE